MKKNTTKLLLHNLSTNELTLIASKQILSSILNVEHETIVNWFRDGVKIVKKQYNNCEYMIYKPDYYLYTRVKT